MWVTRCSSTSRPWLVWIGLATGTAFSTASPAHARCDRPGDADCVEERAGYSGSFDFFATGAAFTINDEPGEDRPNRLRTIVVDGVEVDGAEVVVPERRIPARAKLVEAYLYFGGSLFIDSDGLDAPDTDVEVQVPGSGEFVRVEVDRDDTGLPIGLHRASLPPPFEDAELYVVRANITEAMTAAGGLMSGAYRVRGFEADIFRDSPPDDDGLCSPGIRFNPERGTCEVKHTVANASFSVVLVFEEDRLPPRKIVLFDGLQTVLGSTISLGLQNFRVSRVPSGQITIYAQEGDCHPGPGDCANGNNLSGLERVLVKGANPERRLVLSDPINPTNDVFNRTINTVDPPLTNVAGTDIDRFDITPVLRTDDESVTVEITAPAPDNRGNAGELVGIVYVVVGIDTFMPRFDLDSRIDIRTSRGEKLKAYYPGDPLRVAFALSNTGNLPGTGVRLETDIPANVVDFQVVEEPAGAVVEVDETGGEFGRGQIRVSGISARHGEVDDLVVLMVPECPLPSGGTLEVASVVGAAIEGGRPFTMTSSVPLLPREICGPRFFLYGGAGCGASLDTGGSSSATTVLLAAVASLSLLIARVRSAKLRRPRMRNSNSNSNSNSKRKRKRKRKRNTEGISGMAMLVCFASLSSLHLGCGGDDDAEADRPPPVPVGEDCAATDEMVYVPTLRGLDPFCIDRYEVGLRDGEVGDLDGASTTAVAVSIRFAKPARGVTWFQARAACRNAGKRLCSAEEWTRACRGQEDLTYPYGDVYDPEMCNGYDAIRRDTVETGAMLVGFERADGVVEAQGCVSAVGGYDMSGNLSEWNETDYFGGTRRGLAGGSFRSNRVGLRCVTEDNHAPPTTVDDSVGFRCCR